MFAGGGLAPETTVAPENRFSCVKDIALVVIAVGFAWPNHLAVIVMKCASV